MEVKILIVRVIAFKDFCSVEDFKSEIESFNKANKGLIEAQILTEKVEEEFQEDLKIYNFGKC